MIDKKIIFQLNMFGIKSMPFLAKRRDWCEVWGVSKADNIIVKMGEFIVVVVAAAADYWLFIKQCLL